MKKRIVLLLAAALISVGLVVSCSNDPAPAPVPPTPDPANYTVVFDPAGRPFEDGTTAVKTVVVKDGEKIGDKWPELDEDNIGTDLLKGWFDGDDNEYKRSTEIKKNVILTAKYEAASFTFDSNHSATHTNFVIGVSPGGTHSQWDGEELGDNKFTYTTGGIRYKFPVTVDFDYKDYDFVEVEYTASNAAGLVLKQYGSADGYEVFSGGISNTAENEKKLATWELRQGVEGGFTIQKWNANVPAITIQITRITFIQKTRYKIKFDTDGGTPGSIADSYLVDGTKVSSYLPGGVTKDGFIFGGWMNGAASVSADTTVNSSFNNATLKTLWLADKPGLTSKTITFVGDNSEFTTYGNGDAGSPGPVAITALDGGDATKGFQVGNLNYEWKLYTFKVVLDDGVTLAHYDKITFDFDQTQGSNTNYKNVYVAASNEGTWAVPSAASYIGTKAITNTVASASLTALSFTITKPLAKDLTGTVEVCIYIPAGGNNGPYVIKNIVFVKE
jgi:hypothetical protein